MEASSSSSRSELIRNAVLFLNDPKVASSSLTSRIQFLESKGLNESDIQQALSQASSGGSSSNEGHVGEYQPERPRDPSPRYGNSDRGYGYGYSQQLINPPQPPKRDWRDLFIMAVVSGGVVYGLSVLAKKYLLPHLQPPSTTSFQDTSTALTESYDEAANLLKELTEKTNLLQNKLEEDKEKVNLIIEDVEDTLKNVKSNEEKWREEMRDIRSEVESVRELVPKLIEKHSSSQTSALNDLQNELRSLKTLLISRQGSSNVNSGMTNSTSSPSLSTSSTSSLPSNSTSGISSTTAAANALLQPRNKGIPAWQLPPPSSSSSSQASGSASVGGSGSSTPLNSSGVLVDDKGKGKNKEEPTENGV
ncbi:uncharacterized protein L201_007469 [Kwoniella dendrophila CBS 6074]|uniref:Peroxisomal membrane protein PEX14 n=1 Tax=Kwoniella dendrophila CBS 6074 TaxID=1295534 RepID=A0AAX4K6S6_9TREE